jgi:hypothetical protein
MIGGGTGIIFKGSGFYVTDSKKAAKSGTAPAAKKTETSPSTSTPPPANTETSAKKESA